MYGIMDTKLFFEEIHFHGMALYGYPVVIHITPSSTCS